MLTFSVVPGDDVWLGRKDEPKEDWLQLIIHRFENGILTVLSANEAIDLDLAKAGTKMGVGKYDASIAAWHNPGRDGEFNFGIEAPREVAILRGRLYRRSIDE